MKGIRFVFILLFIGWTMYVVSMFRWVPELIGNQELPVYVRALVAFAVALILGYLIHLSVDLWKLYRDYKRFNNTKTK